VFDQITKALNSSSNSSRVRCATAGVFANLAFANLDASFKSLHKIFARIGMAFWTVSLFCVMSGHCVSAPDVYLGRDGLEMSRIYAKSISAQMINLQAFGNLANMKLVREPMSVKAPSTRLSTSVYTVKHGRKFCIPWAICADPIPTGLCFLNVGKEKRAIVTKEVLISDRGFHV
jgi:hypothetical protein